MLLFFVSRFVLRFLKHLCESTDSAHPREKSLSQNLRIPFGPQGLEHANILIKWNPPINVLERVFHQGPGRNKPENACSTLIGEFHLMILLVCSYPWGPNVTLRFWDKLFFTGMGKIGTFTKVFQKTQHET